MATATSFTAGDITTAGRTHVRAVKAVSDNIFLILDELDLPAVASGKKPPRTMTDLAAAIGRVTKIDQSLRALFKKGAKAGEQARTDFTTLPQADQDMIRAACLQVYGSRSLHELEWSLGHLVRQSRGGSIYMAAALKLGQAIFRAGRVSGSIYDPDSPYWNMAGQRGSGLTIVKKEAGEAVVDAGKKDAGVAVAAGGAAGLKAGNIVAGIEFGLAAGAVASAASLISDLIGGIGDDEVPLLDDIIIEWHPPGPA